MTKHSGWIKLHLSVLQNAVYLSDPTAWRLFEFCLLRAYPSGTFTIGRNQIERWSGIKGVTAWRALQRLKTKEMVTTSVTGKFTTISIVNWGIYQALGNRSGSRSVTDDATKTIQVGNTLREYKNKEERIKKEEEEEQKRANPILLSRSQKLAYRKLFPTLSLDELEEQMRLCNLHMAVSTYSYKNPGQYFKGWLENFLHDRELKKAKEEQAKHVEEISAGISEEERNRNLEKMKEMKEKIFGNFSKEN